MELRRLAYLAAVLALVSCGKEPAPEEEETEPETPAFTILGESPSKVGLVYVSDVEDNASQESAKYFYDYVKACFHVNMKLASTPSGKDIVFDSISDDLGTFNWTIKAEGGSVYVRGGSSWAIRGAMKTLCNDYVAKSVSIPSDISLAGSIGKSCIFERETGSNLRILDWNIWAYDSTTIPAAFYSDGKLLYDPRNSNRGGDFASIVMCLAPDVFTFQEYSSKMDSYFRASLGSKYVMCTTASSYWPYTPVFYNSATVTPKKVEYRLYDAPWSNSNTKSYTAVVFTHKDTGKDFIVLGTHLWYKTESAAAGSDQARLDQVNLVLAEVESLIKAYNVPVFVMGDMNCTLSSSAMQAFVSAGYHSAAQEATVYKDGSKGYHSCSSSGFSAETAASLSQELNGTTAIDHIWFYNCDAASDGSKPSAAVPYYWIIHSSFTYPMSDHAPRFVDVALQ